MRRAIRQCILALLIFSALLLPYQPQALAEADTDGQQIEFVLVLDCSGSMRTSDSEDLSTAAAQLFIDMLPMENSRVSVICFGNKGWKKPFDYQDMLDLELPNKDAFTHIQDRSCVGMLSQSETLDNIPDRSKLKASIETACASAMPNENYTVIGAAMEAAVETLRLANADTDNACIVLMSDGRNKEKSRMSMDAVTKENPYPVYVLELNYDGKNKVGSYARTQLMQCAARYDGDMHSERYLEVKSASSIINALSSVIGRFIDIQSINPTMLTIRDGASQNFTFEVPDMTSETNIVVSGGAFTKLVVTDPSGNEVSYRKTKTDDNNALFIRDGNKYATLKLRTPKIGTWNVKLYGDRDAELYIHAISAKELSFPLRSTAAIDDRLQKNSTVKITAAFEYNGDIVPSDTFYKEHPAVLTVKNTTTNLVTDTLQPEITSQGYSWTATLAEQGLIELQAAVKYEGFRGGEKHSTVLEFPVGNLPLAVNAQSNVDIPPCYVNSVTDPIDLALLFANPDKDAVDYRLECVSDRSMTDAFVLSVDDKDYATIHMADKVGDYAMRFLAKDTDMEEWLEKPFSISLLNRPPERLKRLRVETMVIGVPGLFGESKTHQEIDLSTYFRDPDGLPLVYTLESIDDEALSAVIEDGKLVIDATAPASEKLVLHVNDSNGDPGDEIVEKVNVESVRWFASVVRKNIKWILLIAALAVITVLLLSMRRVKGSWRVIVTDTSENKTAENEFSSLSSLRKFRKPSFDLKRLVSTTLDAAGEEINLACINRNAPIICGSLFIRKATFRGVNKSSSRAEVILIQNDGKERTLPPKKKRVALPRGETIQFVYKQNDGELTVTLTLS